MTVNCSLPIYSNGTLAYADYGFNASSPANSLWIPLAEKAYAQWNETGKEGRDGQNTYACDRGRLDGHRRRPGAGTQCHRLQPHRLDRAGDDQCPGRERGGDHRHRRAATADTLPYGLYGSHAYAVIGYNASTGLFTLYNPWGFDQPGVLSWSQLEATCDGFVVANAAGSTPISGATSGPRGRGRFAHFGRRGRSLDFAFGHDERP